MLSHTEFLAIMQASRYLEQNLVRMAEVAEVEYETFLADWRWFASAERVVQTSVEALQDIARPLARQLGAPSDISGREALLFVHAGGAVTIERELLERMTSMRNRIVHAYAVVDPAIIYAVCAAHRGDVSHVLAQLMRLTMKVAPSPDTEISHDME